jgi:hypothetical protein
MDGILSLTILFILFLYTAHYITSAKLEAKNELVLANTAADIATVLEKSGDLENAVTSASNRTIREFINKLPYAICVEIRIFHSSDLNNPLIVVLREECTFKSKKYYSFQRSFIVRSGSDANIYLADVKTWMR